MSLSITNYPNDAASWSYWSALHNGVKFRFKRQDIAIATIGSEDIGGGVMKSVVRYVTPQTPLTAGDFVYIESGDNIGVFEVYITETGLTANYVVLTVNTLIPSIGGFLNADTLRENYYIEVEIYKRLSSGDFLIGSTQKVTPTSDGIGILDVSEWLQADTKQYGYSREITRESLTWDRDEDFDYSAVNIKDDNVFLKYNIKYKECWIGSNNSFSSFLANDYYVVKAVQQLGATYGENLGEYVFAVDNVEFYKSILTIQGGFDGNTKCRVVTMESHLLTSGDLITITGTVYFDGDYTVDTIISPVEFDFLKAGVFYWNSGTVSKKAIKTAKFLSDFVEPYYFEGYPFSLSFIYNDDGYIAEAKKVEELLDINKAVDDHNEYDLDVTQNAAVNHLTLAGTYPATTEYVDVWLETGIAVIAHYVEDDYVEDDYVV